MNSTGKPKPWGKTSCAAGTGWTPPSTPRWKTTPPERVSAIDRAILRLGAYELLHRKDLPAPIVISEAIRLSERFSSAESPRFVNGVLAGISKTEHPA